MSRHGMVRAVDTHFEYEDGTLFWPFGTTVYALAHQKQELIEETFKSLSESPFNKVRMCVFPKHYQYNNNEPDFYPFEKSGDGWDVQKPVESFWKHLEGIIERLDSMEIQCDLILFHPYDNWGFSDFSLEDDLKYLDYVIKRLGHLDNIWWSMANEYDLLLAKKPISHWEAVEEFIAANDIRHHLLSNHNCFKIWSPSRKNITHGSFQTKRMPDLAGAISHFKKPIIDDECCYEGDLPEYWGSISGQEMTSRFWQAIVSGSYCTHGETFLDPVNEIVWWSKGGRLKGQSVQRIAFLKNIVEELPGPIEATDSMKAMLDNMTEEERLNIERSKLFESFKIATSMLTPEQMHMHTYAEYCYLGHCGEQVFLEYFFMRCSKKGVINLPLNKKYRLELIDTWNMTRETIMENASGIVEYSRPPREYMALMATVMD